MKIFSKSKTKVLAIGFGCCLLLLSQSGDALEHKSPAGTKDGRSLEIVATVNNQHITVPDFEKEMIKQGGLSMERFENRDEKMRVLEEMISFELFFSEALKAGYDKDPEIVTSLKKQMVQKYLQKDIEPKLQAIEITEDEISRYYQEHIDEYQKHSLSKIALIVIKTPKQISGKEKERLKAKAEEALLAAQEEKPEDNSFGKIAKKYSDDPMTQYKGGIIGWFSPKERGRNGLSTEVFDAALALQDIGEISPVITTREGFYLIKLAGKKVFQPVTLKEAEPEIRPKLYAEKKRGLYRNFCEKLKKGAGISINHDLVDSIKGQEIEAARHEHRPPSFPLEIR